MSQLTTPFTEQRPPNKFGGTISVKFCLVKINVVLGENITHFKPLTTFFKLIFYFYYTCNNNYEAN